MLTDGDRKKKVEREVALKFESKSENNDGLDEPTVIRCRMRSDDDRWVLAQAPHIRVPTFQASNEQQDNGELRQSAYGSTGS